MNISTFAFVILAFGFSGNLKAASLPKVDSRYSEEKQIKEDNVVFTYSSNDGSMVLKCTHILDKPEVHDWDIWCGKAALDKITLNQSVENDYAYLTAEIKP